jgi:hypothetical protein
MSAPTQNPTTYVYDPTALEAFFAELAANDDTCPTPTWSTKYVYDRETEKWSYVEDETHDTFECGDVTFQWYHGHNMKNPDQPRLVASWTSNYRVIDWDEHEDVIPLDLSDVVWITNIANDFPSSESPYDTIAEARGEA